MSSFLPKKRNLGDSVSGGEVMSAEIPDGTATSPTASPNGYSCSAKYKYAVNIKTFYQFIVTFQAGAYHASVH